MAAVVPREKGGLVIGAYHRFAVLDEETGKTETIAKIRENPNARMNDGKCDSKGRFWMGE